MAIKDYCDKVVEVGKEVYWCEPKGPIVHFRVKYTDPDLNCGSVAWAHKSIEVRCYDCACRKGWEW